MTKSHSEVGWTERGGMEALPNLLTTKQVAGMLGVHTDTVRELVRTGKLRDIRLGWRTRRYRLEDVLAYQHAAMQPVKATDIGEQQ
jgi:excisionase family DNA binding protein